jgi:hypothetical protein
MSLGGYISHSASNLFTNKVWGKFLIAMNTHWAFENITKLIASSPHECWILFNTYEFTNSNLGIEFLDDENMTVEHFFGLRFNEAIFMYPSIMLPQTLDAGSWKKDSTHPMFGIFCQIWEAANQWFFHKSLTSCTYKKTQATTSLERLKCCNKNCRNPARILLRGVASVFVWWKRTHPFPTHVGSRFSSRLVNNLCDRHTERER